MEMTKSVVQVSIFVSIRDHECQMPNSVWHIVGTEEIVMFL